MAAVADDEKISVVVKPSLVRLDEDVRLRSEGGSGVEEVVLKANLSAVGRAPHQHLVLLAQALDPAEARKNEPTIMGRMTSVKNTRIERLT